MPFDTDVSLVGSSTVKDYSTYSNDGTLSGTEVWTDGYGDELLNNQPVILFRKLWCKSQRCTQSR